VTAICKFKGAIRLLIAGYEVQDSIGHVEDLKTIAQSAGIASAVEYLGTIPLREDLLRFAAKANIGLSLMPMQSEDINVQHMVGASNKPFDFMACGLPLLTSCLPDWDAIFVKPGFARMCDPRDVDSIETELRWFLDHPEARREMGERCKEKIRHAWNYESMFEPVVVIMESPVRDLAYKPELDTSVS
jgi:spore maturation protein CgeB